MKPIEFPESNKVLTGPANMTEEECGTAPVFTDGKECITKWKMTWSERLHCLFRGHLWISLLSGYTMPPISVFAEKTIFEPVVTEEQAK